MKYLSLILILLSAPLASGADTGACEKEAREYVAHFQQAVVEKTRGYSAEWSKVDIESNNERFHFFISTGNSRGDYRDYEYVVNMTAGVNECQLIDFKYLGITDWGYGGND